MLPHHRLRITTAPSKLAPPAASTPARAFAHHALALETTLIRSNPLESLDTLLRAHPDAPFLVLLSYELAHHLEPSIPVHPTDFPPITAQRLAPSSYPTPSDPAPFAVDTHDAHITDAHTYTTNVQRALEYIAAGDIYQVNLAHPIRAPFAGCALALAHTLFHHTDPIHPAFLIFDDPATNTRHAVISCSPETFLTYDPTSRTLATEPMKGTRPLGTDPDELRDDPKERAELNMIVDLMRNDLGRVATPGSVRVTHPRTITPHPSGVLQATARIEARVRDHLTLPDILRATFPAGSITGAPKIRAAQIIHELESSPRAPYCGSTLLLHPTNPTTHDRPFTASVNIRTLHIQGTPDPNSPTAFKHATLTYHTGAGIVADSTPDAEWQETLTKAALLESALNLPISPRTHT